MPVNDLITTPCTLIQRTPSASVDELGNEVPGENLVNTVCALDQVQTDEPATEGEASVTTWMLFFQTGTEVRTGDAVDVEGYGQFELVGDPWDARRGPPSIWHVECRAKQTVPPDRGVS